MPICVVVLKEKESAEQLISKAESASSPYLHWDLIQPCTSSQSAAFKSEEQNNHESSEFKTVSMFSLPLLNPRLSRKLRQKGMAKWLMPFGFLAGLTFSQMTGLQTFSSFGLGKWGEPIIGSLLGMFSGLLGSYVSSASVGSENKDELKLLKERNEDGHWLILLQTSMSVDLPWRILQEANSVEVIKLSDL